MPQTKDRPDILVRVFKAAGNARKLSIALGLTRQALSRWKRVPAVHVVAVAQISGIEPKEIRPDVFRD